MVKVSERAIIRTLMELSRNLVADYDVVEVLERLTSSSLELLDASSAGLVLVDGRDELHLMASSTADIRHLDLFDVGLGDGPVVDSLQQGAAIAVRDLNVESRRWPQFHRAAQEVGITSVHTVPVRLGSDVLGTLVLLGTDTGAFKYDDLALAQTLADVATVTIVNERTAADRSGVDSRLEIALTSRIVVEQAKGVIAHGAGLDTNAAFDCLCDYARHHRRRLSEVANEIVHHDDTLEAVLAHARTDSWVRDSARVTR